MYKNTNRPLSLDLASLSKAYLGALSKKLEHIPLDRYFFLLVAIKECDEESPVTQQKLCEQLNIDKASLVRILDYLSEKQFIRRSVNPDDRREHFVLLTEKGDKLIPEIKKAIDETNKEALSGFSPKEQADFYQFLYRLCGNLSALPAHVVEFELKRISKS